MISDESVGEFANCAFVLLAAWTTSSSIRAASLDDIVDIDELIIVGEVAFKKVVHPRDDLGQPLPLFLTKRPRSSLRQRRQRRGVAIGQLEMALALTLRVWCVSTTCEAYEAVCTPITMRKSPETIVQAGQFSAPYTVACALVKGDVGLADFTEAGLRDPAVRTLAACVDARLDEDIERGWSRNVSPTRLVVETDAGTLRSAWIIRAGMWPPR